MLKIPENLNSSFVSFLSRRKVPANYINYYLKWLRYYLDFCYKYGFQSISPNSLPRFLNKLNEKNQTSPQQKQAHASILLFYEMVKQYPNIKTRLSHLTEQKDPISAAKEMNPKSENEEKNTRQTHVLCGHDLKPELLNSITNCDWKNIFAELSNEIEVRHYSPKTLKSYMLWARKLQYFTKSKRPEALSASDVKEFLTFLAVKQKVSASSQNQAFNALLFLFKNVLKKNLGNLTALSGPKENPISQLSYRAEK